MPYRMSYLMSERPCIFLSTSPSPHPNPRIPEDLDPRAVFAPVVPTAPPILFRWPPGIACCAEYAFGVGHHDGEAAVVVGEAGGAAGGAVGVCGVGFGWVAVVVDEAKADLLLAFELREVGGGEFRLAFAVGG